MEKEPLDIRLFEDRESMGRAAAEETAAAIAKIAGEQKEINMIFAAAPSQNEFLRHLIGHGEIPWNSINAFHMDEYIGIDKDAPQGFANFLQARLFDRMPFKSVHLLNSQAEDAQAECERYARLLKEHPVDITCLGIGENGHIAFNDPHVARFDDPALVKIVELDEKCRMQQVHDGCFKDIADVPRRAITLTIPALTAASRIICVVPGASKAWAVRRTVRGDISEACPASILRLHRHVAFFTDKEGGKYL